MNVITVNYSTGDNCGSVSSVLSVSSNEPQIGLGNGDAGPDWTVDNNHQVQLRAERDAHGTGRIYTILITATDGFGNTSTATAIVTVPKSNTANRSPEAEIITQSQLTERLEVIARPNPARSQFTIQLKGSPDEIIKVEVTDIYGRTIERRQVPSGQIFTIGMNYRPGAYIAHFMQGNEHSQIKLVKLSD
jgi:hypothetical protein